MLTVMLAAFAMLADTSPAAAAAAAPATSAQAAAPAKTTQVAQKTDSDIVCHKEKVIGTMIPIKICRSRSQDALNRAESRATVEKWQSQSSVPNYH